MKEPIYPRWEVVLYHDEPEDAATNSIVMGKQFESEADAIEEAVSLTTDRPDPYWNGGATVHIGTYFPGRFGVEPSRFETDDNATPIYVFDGIVDRNG